ncbi:MAG: FkbM family methyltransferase [Acidobacteriota bacterium]
MNTKKLFLALLKRTRCQTVCDVGSMDGAESLDFARALPDASVLALEANRENYDRMMSDARLVAAGVEVLHKAASEANGEAEFHVADVDYSSTDANRGESSLLSGYSKTKRVDTVETVRLDALLADAAAPIALWIDVEGADHQVVEGLEGIKDKVSLIHIELDLVPYWPEEVPGDQTRALLKDFGFQEIASQFYPDGPGAPGWDEQLEQSARRSELFDSYVAEASGNVILGSSSFVAENASAIRRSLSMAATRATLSKVLGR